MVKKGQGALEFLMTYGWAFLVILIMIGALAYFGILDPTKFLPDRCSFGSEVTCRDTAVSSAGDVSLRLVNGLGISVQVKNFSISNPDGFTCSNLNTSISSNETFVWQRGETVDFLGTGCTGGGIQDAAGDKFKFNVKINWYDIKSNQNYMHTTEGEVFRGVQ